MTPLKDALLKAGEFDESFINESKIWLTHRDRNVASDAAYLQYSKMLPLLEACAEVVEALEFYASKKNWDDRWVDFPDDTGDDVFDVIDMSDVDIENVGEEGEPCLTYGGKIARQALARLRERLEKKGE